MILHNIWSPRTLRNFLIEIILQSLWISLIYVKIYSQNLAVTGWSSVYLEGTHADPRCSLVEGHHRATGSAQQSNLYVMFSCIVFWFVINTTAYYLGWCGLHLLLLKSFLADHLTTIAAIPVYGNNVQLDRFNTELFT